MRAFIQKGGQVNLSSTNGFFPLHLAAFKGDVDLVSLLVENMSPEEISFPGKVVLHIFFGFTVFKKYLLAIYTA